LNLARIVENLAPLLEHAVGASISLDCAIAPSVSAIEVNPAQLESAIVNLVINARDAIPENGRFCIAAANAAVADAQARSLGLASGSYVRLSVQDDGAGMPAAVRARVFEPFFSTKGADRGTGLGLSMVRWFAENHGGAVLVESEEGSGTTITIFLPSAAAPDEDSALLTMPLKSLPGGDENVLLIARDPHLGETTRDSLAVLGYRVTLSGDVRAIGPQLRTGKFALLMLDVATVGDSRVVALGRALRQRFPLVKLIVIAGSSSGAAVGGPSGAGVLGMPFTLKDVALLVRATLEGENHGR
jgi:hypothetical protein